MQYEQAEPLKAAGLSDVESGGLVCLSESQNPDSCHHSCPTPTSLLVNTKRRTTADGRWKLRPNEPRITDSLEILQNTDTREHRY